MKLRPYQKELVDKIFENWNAGRRAVMLQLPTGGGKTVIFSSIIREIVNKAGGRGIAMVHVSEVVEQLHATLNTLGLPSGLIQAGKKPDLSLSSQVASVQTLVRRKAPPADIVVIDEAHHVTASSYRAILDKYPNANILGVTATPWRLSGEGFADIFDALVIGPSVKSLIEKGFLCRFKYFVPDTMNLYSLKKRAGEFVVDDDTLTALTPCVLDAYEKHASGMQGVVFCADIEHSQIIADAYCARFGPGFAACLSSKTPKKVRDKMISDFRRGGLRVITNFNVISEGFDLPGISFVQCLAPTASLSKYLQMVGRGLRIAEQKSHAVILDHANLWELHRRPDADRNWKKHFFGKEFSNEVHVDAIEEESLYYDDLLSLFEDEKETKKKKKDINEELFSVLSQIGMQELDENLILPIRAYISARSDGRISKKPASVFYSAMRKVDQKGVGMSYRAFQWIVSQSAPEIRPFISSLRNILFIEGLDKPARNILSRI